MLDLPNFCTLGVFLQRAEVECCMDAGVRDIPHLSVMNFSIGGCIGPNLHKMCVLPEGVSRSCESPTLNKNPHIKTIANIHQESRRSSSTFLLLHSTLFSLFRVNVGQYCVLIFPLVLVVVEKAPARICLISRSVAGATRSI